MDMDPQKIQVADVAQWLPQRPPILMLDQVINLVPGQSGTGVKRFSADDTYFQGHFPGEPILPGIYLIEALAQTALVVLAYQPKSTEEKQLGYLAKVEKMAFYQPIKPGMELFFSIRVTRRVGRFVMVDCEATMSEKRCAKGSLTLAI